MTAIDFSLGPCEAWTTAAAAAGCCGGEVATQELVEEFVLPASQVLFQLSGGQFAGSCSRVARPSSAMVVKDRSLISTVGYRWGEWRDWSGCACGWLPGYAARTCGSTPVIDLGYYPLTSITDVTIDEDAVDLSLLRIDDHRYLIREDGIGWPCCQDLSLPPGEVGTWSVGFTFGEPIPEMGVIAANKLACELALACSDDDEAECSLPQRTTQVVRQGVSYVVMDPFDMLTEGRTGLYEVDLFLTTYDPEKFSGAPSVVTPDWPPRTTQTTWRST